MTRSTLIRLPPQELVGTFPRGEGKSLMFLVVLKNYKYQYVFWHKQRKNIPRARLPLGGKVSPSECDGRRMRGNVQFLSVKQFDKPKFEACMFPVKQITSLPKVGGEVFVCFMKRNYCLCMISP